MKAPKRYTEAEALALLKQISKEAADNSLQMTQRFVELEEEFNEVFEAVLADGALVKYAAAMRAFMLQLERRGGIRQLSSEDQMVLMLKFSTWFYMYKQDILSRLGAEE